MKDEKKAPKLRFKGFTDDWEQCKLGDVADITTGSRNHQDSVTDGKYPFFVRSDKVERLNEYDFDTRAILVPGDGRIGEIFHYYNGKFALHQRVYKVDNFNGINELFLLGQFKCSFKKHALRLNAQGTVPSLRLPMFTNWNISIPNITEQERIGSFFRKLDQTITLHEEKKRQLECIKSALLQKMFANKSEYPAIRFEGFSDEWGPCKLGDVANFSKGTGYSKSDLKGTGSPIILYGRLYTKYETIIRNVDTFVVPKSGSVFSKGGEVIVPGSGETAEDISIASVVEPAGILLGGDLNIIYPNSDLDPAFLAITISNGKPHFDMARRAQGKSVVHLHNADLKHILLKTPNLSEQKRISKIFESLDQTITLHDQKLSFLKRLKQTLLQKMFI